MHACTRDAKTILVARLKKFIKWSVLVVAAAVLVFAGMEWWNTYAPSAHRQRLKFALNLIEVPRSVRDLRCPPSNVITDVIVKCEFSYAAEDLPALLKGWEFRQIYSGRYDVQPLPPQFKHGGELYLELLPGPRASVFYYME